MSRHSKVIAQTGRHTDSYTDTRYENITFPHTRAVITDSEKKRQICILSHTTISAQQFHINTQVFHEQIVIF